MSGRSTEQTEAACPVSWLRHICHINLILVPTLFHQGISNGAAENPWDAADKQFCLISLQENSDVKSSSPSSFTPPAESRITSRGYRVATEAHRWHSGCVTAVKFLPTPGQVQWYGRTRSSPTLEVQKRLTLSGNILSLLVSYISEVDQCVLYAASALQTSKHFRHLGLLEKQAFLSSGSISEATQSACKPQSPKWQHRMSVFGSIWICLWGKPITGSCWEPSNKGSFVSWAVTVSSVDSCNQDCEKLASP